jgi:predicted RNA methylase
MELKMNAQNELGQFIPLHYHYQMLLDSARVTGFQTAIDRVVPEGGVVVELGGGTGVLSFFAAQKARKVYYVEFNPELVETARKLLAQNKNGHKVEIIHADATLYVPPEEADAVVCEMLHVALLREKQLQVIDAFKKNYHAEYNKLPAFIPFATIQAIQPVNHPFEFNGYKAAVPMFNDPYAQAPDITELGAPVVYHQLLYAEDYGFKIAWTGNVTMSAAGTFNALRVITKSLLSGSSPADFVDWHNQYLICPLEKPYEVTAGDVLEISFEYTAGEPLTALMPRVRAV